jgi:aspartyl-tRNA(Asn)/glutamyl-tRNA(Gln) amidotransferase subunit B
MSSKYLPTIGIETHVQLNTKTKLFAAVGNDAREVAPNTLISHICVGMPGALPVLNEGAIKLSAAAALALGTAPQKLSHFERKHYFYPDLPKGYQITQYQAPIIVGGHLHIDNNGQKKCIRIERANLEEDAGKNTHPAGADYSLVDLNRAGTPLLEIVSRPDLNSPAEAKAYARELWLLMKYAGVTDGDLYHGHVRFDVNISLSKDPDKLGTRSEIKNLNSFRSVEGAVTYEIERQTELLEKGQPVVQETRGWDEVQQKSVSQRSKEEAEDYRYMPEPDVPPVELDDKYIEDIEKQMPELPPKIRQELAKIKFDSKVIEDILDRPEAVALILKVLDTADSEATRRTAFWVLQSAGNPANLKADKVVELSKMVDDGKLSSTAGKTIFEEMIKSPETPDKIAKRLKLVQVSDESEIEKIVAEVITQNPKAAEDVKAGQAKAIGFLVGQVMAKSKGQANPEVAQKLIKKQLGG